MKELDVLPCSLGAVLSLCAALTLPACSAEGTTQSSGSSAAAAAGSGTAGAASSAVASSSGAGGQAASAAGPGGAGSAGGTGGLGGAGGSGEGGSGMGSSSSGAGGSGMGGSSSGEGGSGGGGGGQGAIVPKLTGLQMYVDCMPTVSPDPVHGSFNASYDNSLGTAPAVATITSARLVLGLASDWKFSVTPNGSGLVAAGATVNGTHMKLDATGSGSQPPCSFCNGTWGLEVTWNAGGTLVTDTLPPMPVQCVF